MEENADLVDESVNKLSLETLEILKNQPPTAEELVELRTSVSWSSDIEQIKKAIDGSYSVYTIRNGEELIACCRVISDGAIHATLVDVIVHPNFQSLGIGKKLVMRALTDLKSDGIRFIGLTFNPTDTKLVHFYNSCGFQSRGGALFINQEA